MSVLRDLLGRFRQRGEPPMEAAPDRDPEAETAEVIRSLVAQGYVARGEIIDTAVEINEDATGADADRERIAAQVDDALAAHRAASAAWPAVTDCDRLDRAFAALATSRIVARQDFACCQTCGFAEIGDEVDDPAATMGFTFFHRQDTESAVDGGGLYLSYGSFSTGDEATLEVARRVVASLREAGLEPSWNGSIDRRLAVPMDWQRRRPT